MEHVCSYKDQYFVLQSSFQLGSYYNQFGDKGTDLDSTLYICYREHMENVDCLFLQCWRDLTSLDFASIFLYYFC